jgi:hypothetical protein
VDSGAKGPEANHEWAIGEPLRRSISSLPLQPGATKRYALSEMKPLAEDELVSLERRGHLTDEEHRQAGALRRLVSALEEWNGENGAG